MSEREILSKLIGQIYDAALEPALWPGVLEQSCGFVKGWSAGLFVQDAVKQTGNAYFTWNISEEYIQLYFEKYLSLSPFMPALLFYGVGEVVGNADLVAHDEFRASHFYREWASPQGLVDTVAANVDKSATNHAVFSIMRHEQNGIVDLETRELFGLLVPHVRRAILIGNVIDLHTIEAASMADALDGLAAGVFFVDAAGNVVHANARGNIMINSEQNVLKSVSGRLTACDAHAARVLANVLGAADVDVSGIAVPLTARSGEQWVAHVLPLTSGERRKAGVVYSAVAAIFVRPAALDLSAPLETMANIYRLTPSELKILVAIVRTGGVSEVASLLGLSESTVKTHLQHLFNKTNTNRQADLVKLVAGYESPLRGPTLS